MTESAELTRTVEDTKTWIAEQRETFTTDDGWRNLDARSNDPNASSWQVTMLLQAEKLRVQHDLWQARLQELTSRRADKRTITATRELVDSLNTYIDRLERPSEVTGKPVQVIEFNLHPMPSLNPSWLPDRAADVPAMRITTVNGDPDTATVWDIRELGMGAKAAWVPKVARAGFKDTQLQEQGIRAASNDGENLAIVTRLTEVPAGLVSATQTHIAKRNAPALVKFVKGVRDRGRKPEVRLRGFSYSAHTAQIAAMELCEAGPEYTPSELTLIEKPLGTPLPRHTATGAPAHTAEGELIWENLTVGIGPASLSQPKVAATPAHMSAAMREAIGSGRMRTMVLNQPDSILSERLPHRLGQAFIRDGVEYGAFFGENDLAARREDVNEYLEWPEHRFTARTSKFTRWMKKVEGQMAAIHSAATIPGTSTFEALAGAADGKTLLDHAKFRPRARIPIASRGASFVVQKAQKPLVGMVRMFSPSEQRNAHSIRR